MKEGGGEAKEIMGEATDINSGSSGKRSELQMVIEQPVSAPNDSCSYGYP